MFGIGAGELLVLMALALIIIGPQKLPETGRTIGRALADFKAYSNDMRSAISLDQPPPPQRTTFLPGSASSPSYSDAVAVMSQGDGSKAAESVEGSRPLDEGTPNDEEAAVDQRQGSRV